MREQLERMLQDHDGQPRYYDRTGRPLRDVMEWAEWMRPENFEKNRRVGHTMFYGIEISTVCLGLDHSFMGGPPLIFETMTFPDNECWRYHTESEARRGHRKVWWYLARMHVLAATLSVAIVMVALAVMARA